MIKEFNNSLGYYCPNCSSIVMKSVNLFDLSGKNSLELDCPNEICGEHCIRISQKKDKYAISVNCPMCDDTHIFNIHKSTFWQNGLFRLNCPETEIGIIFIGDPDKVRKEMDEQENTVLAPDGGLDAYPEFGSIFVIFDRIITLANNNKISCSCGHRDISIEAAADNVTLRCPACGNNRIFRATPEDLNELLNTSAIVLD